MIPVAVRYFIFKPEFNKSEMHFAPVQLRCWWPSFKLMTVEESWLDQRSPSLTSFGRFEQGNILGRLQFFSPTPHAWNSDRGLCRVLQGDENHFTLCWSDIRCCYSDKPDLCSMDSGVWWHVACGQWREGVITTGEYFCKNMYCQVPGNASILKPNLGKISIAGCLLQQHIH